MATKYAASEVTLRTRKPLRGRKPFQRSLRLPTDATELAYLAGILDGEGSISTLRPSPGGGKKQRRWPVTISSTHVPLIEWLGTFGGNVHEGSHNPLGRLPCMNWTVVAWRDALYLLESLRPYLRIKAEKADQAMQDLRMWIEEAEE